jgi:hypothetical protein
MHRADYQKVWGQLVLKLGLGVVRLVARVQAQGQEEGRQA